MHTIRYFADSVAATERLAQVVSKLLRPGDVVVLQGELAAGKTQFVQACVTALGYEGVASSPTFTIANFYKTPSGTVIHTDLYRVKAEQELQALGLSDYADDAITFVEWGDKFIGFFDDFLHLSFSFPEGQPEARLITIDASRADWATRLSAIDFSQPSTL